MKPGAAGDAVGSLVIVGSGIEIGGHLTAEARHEIEAAEEVLHLVTNPVAAAVLERLNANSSSLTGFYDPEKLRQRSYEEMADALLARARAGRRVCVVFYGHPGVFVRPTAIAMERARAEGLPARVLPGISTEDCLFADLGVDPAADGCQTYDATDFLAYPRRFDTCTPLILLQVGFIGVANAIERSSVPGVEALAERLEAAYGTEHVVTLYEASEFPGVASSSRHVPVCDLAATHVDPVATLFVPPLRRPRADAAMIERFGIKELQLRPEPED